jgi:hypothetical protein
MSPFLATEKGATSVASKHFGFMKKKMSRSGAAPQESSEVPVSVASKSKHFKNLFKKQPSMKNCKVVEEAPPLDKAPIVEPKESRTESPAVENGSSMATERMAYELFHELFHELASPVMVEEVKSDDAAPKPKEQPVEVMDSPVVGARNSPVVFKEEVKEKETRKEDERKEEEEEEEEALDDDQQEYITKESFDSFELYRLAINNDGGSMACLCCKYEACAY